MLARLPDDPVPETLSLTTNWQSIDIAGYATVDIATPTVDLYWYFGDAPDVALAGKFPRSGLGEEPLGLMPGATQLWLRAVQDPADIEYVLTENQVVYFGEPQLRGVGNGTTIAYGSLASAAVPLPTSPSGYWRLQADHDVRVELGTSPVADGNSQLVQTGSAVRHVEGAGPEISVIQASAGQAGGLNIVPYLDA